MSRLRNVDFIKESTSRESSIKPLIAKSGSLVSKTIDYNNFGPQNFPTKARDSFLAMLTTRKRPSISDRAVDRETLTENIANKIPPSIIDLGVKLPLFRKTSRILESGLCKTVNKDVLIKTKFGDNYSGLFVRKPSTQIMLQTKNFELPVNYSLSSPSENVAERRNRIQQAKMRMEAKKAMLREFRTASVHIQSPSLSKPLVESRFRSAVPSPKIIKIAQNQDLEQPLTHVRKATLSPNQIKKLDSSKKNFCHKKATQSYSQSPESSQICLKNVKKVITSADKLFKNLTRDSLMSNSPIKPEVFVSKLVINGQLRLLKERRVINTNVATEISDSSNTHAVTHTFELK